MKELNYSEIRKSLARKRFWEYCKLTSGDFYKEERHFLKDLAEKLQWFIEEAEEQIMVVNMPPRHGKSRTATKFVQWLLGKYGVSKKVMTGSYNETLSGTFAKAVRDVIAEKPTAGVVVYNDILRERVSVKVQSGDDSFTVYDFALEELLGEERLEKVEEQKQEDVSGENTKDEKVEDK